MASGLYCQYRRGPVNACSGWYMCRFCATFVQKDIGACLDMNRKDELAMEDTSLNTHS